MFKIKNRFNQMPFRNLGSSNFIHKIDIYEKKKVNRLLRLTLLHLKFSAIEVDLFNSVCWENNS